MLMKTSAKDAAARLSALRDQLQNHALDGLIIPISDEFLSEYVGDYAQRLGWLTGFGGSAGTAIVLADKAAIFVDGRYVIQVREQVDGTLYEYCQVPHDSLAKWLGENAAKGAKIGYDAWLHTYGWVENLGKVLAQKDIALVPTNGNLIDAIWTDKPQPSLAQAFPYADELAGQGSADKRAGLSDWLKRNNLDATVVSALDSIAWLLNIRGGDVDKTPVTFSYVIAKADGTAELYIAREKITPELEKHLGNAIAIKSFGDFAQGLAALSGKNVNVDPDYGAAAIGHALEAAGAKITLQRDPIILAKAVKNPVEVQGHKDAQARDGAAIAKFLHWVSVHAPKGGETELSAAAALRGFREESGQLQDLSFDTISAAGPNGAMCHYSVDDDSNRAITPGSIFLCDSGGQYLDGTTDITRTMWVGTPDGAAQPSAEHKDRFTRVLKGHIALEMARFPAGTNGSQLDALARQFLWQAGLDYAHGTGHGVGAYLSVHEGPQRIAKATGPQGGTLEPLQAGMILSNEPGYYKAGEYGIRIENLILTVPVEINGQEGDYLGFETLTFAPIDRNLVEVSLLSAEEIAWWNTYHAKVEALLAPQLQGDVLAWLKTACAPF